MKKSSLIFIALMICSVMGLAQEIGRARYGIQASYGNPGYIPSFADFAPTFEGRYFFDIGLLYMKPISEKWDF